MEKETPKHVVSNVAKAVASIILSTDPKQISNSVVRFISDVESKNEQTKYLALFVLGEIGRKTDLGGHANLQKTILNALDSSSEEIRQAASFSFGNIAVGNLGKYLPEVLQQIQKSSQTRYLLLHSLKEVIDRKSTSSEGISQLQPFQGQILSLLYQNSENTEEGTRNVVAECLGKLALMNPKELVPTLLSNMQSKSPFTRATVVTSLKFAIVDKPQEVDNYLHPNMSSFLNGLKDSDLNVRKSTLLSLNYAAHNKPNLIRQVLPDFLPLIYSESKVKKELIREVDLGPFKYKVDDGLEIRKAAFECMYTLLDTCVDRIDVAVLVTNLADALKDHYDIKLLADLILIRTAHVAGPALLEGLDQLVDPLRAIVTTKVKDGAPKQEVESNEELIRSALRAIVAISKIPNAESNRKFDEFLNQTLHNNKELASKLAAIKAEADNLEQTEPMDLS